MGEGCLVLHCQIFLEEGVLIVKTKGLEFELLGFIVFEGNTTLYMFEVRLKS